MPVEEVVPELVPPPVVEPDVVPPDVVPEVPPLLDEPEPVVVPLVESVDVPPVVVPEIVPLPVEPEPAVVPLVLAASVLDALSLDPPPQAVRPIDMADTKANIAKRSRSKEEEREDAGAMVVWSMGMFEDREDMRSVSTQLRKERRNGLSHKRRRREQTF